MTRREKIEAMLATEPGDVFLNYALAMEFVKEGSVDAAIAQFEKVITIDPAYVGAYLQIGQALHRAGRVDEARAHLARGIQAATAAGNAHAADEMRGLLAELG
jgi:Tfp pilus assembly protein PilF